MNNTVRKITITAMLLALTIIFTKVLGINPGFWAVRISFGPALIILSSLYLGPVYGLIVGAGSDVLGALIFPTGEYQPLFTLVYGLLGVFPWVLNFIFKKINKPKLDTIIFNVFLALWLCVVLTIVWCFPQIDKMAMQIIYSAVAVALTIGTSISIFFINKFFKNRNSEYDGRFYRYALVCMCVEIAVMVFGNSLVKSFHFEQPYLLMIEWMGLVSFINIPVNSFGSYYLELLLQKIKH